MRNHDAASDSSAAPAASATVLLLRDSAPGRIEVLLQQRHAELRFMGGHWVFPGGREAAADAQPDLLARIHAGVDADRLARLRSAAGPPLPPVAALAAHVTACRETFEEAGVLLASRRDGSACRGRALQQALALRADTARDPARFREALERAKAWLDPARLVYWSHWITPLLGTQPRFDTRFFAVALPEGQVVHEDGGEAVASAWVDPAEACARAERGELQLAPPTLLTLLDLARAARSVGSVAALLLQEAGRAPPPVTPRLRVEQSSRRLLMPWHPDYVATPGAGIPAEPDWPEWLTRGPAEFQPAQRGG
jgi:8-oxo-dGTP pyrophosphatase MutT (NUDIX family)